jgi:LPXTG-motif cell wall-anchored protein
MKKYFNVNNVKLKHIHKIFIFGIYLISLILIIQNIPAEKTNNSIIYVSSSGIGNFSTIQDGIDAATTNDTVFVYNGTYYENIVIDKSITLLAENTINTIIDGRGTGNVIKINADYVIIKGFTIQHSGLIFPNSGINLSSNQNLIENNLILNNLYGMTLYKSSMNIIKGNTIQNNDNCGIYMSQSSRNLIISNTIQNQFYNGIGIYDSSDENLIEGNNLTNHGYSGVNIQKSSDNNVIGNNFTGNHIGIHLPRTQNTIKDNTFSNNDINIDQEFFLTETESILLFAIGIVIIILGIFLFVRRKKKEKN